MDLLELPDLVLHRILTFLGPLDLLALASTSKNWFNLIRNEDSLWIPHFKTYSRGIWNEILDDIQVLGDPRISDWFVYYCQRLKNHRRHAKPIVTIGKETWMQIHNRDFIFESAILARSYEMHEDICKYITILDRKYVYNLQLFERKDRYIDFEKPFDGKVKTDLEKLGQARERDLLSRKHAHLQSKYVVLAGVEHDVHFEDRSRISNLFTSTIGKCLEPLFTCRVSMTSPTSSMSMCTPSAGLAAKLQNYSDRKFDSFFKSSGHEGLRKYCQLMRDECSDLFIETSDDEIEGNPRPLFPYGQYDAFIASCRQETRDRINRVVRSVLIPPNSPGSHVFRVDLTDAAELGRDNSQQEMVSSVIISDNAALLVMQLTGRSRH